MDNNWNLYQYEKVIQFFCQTEIRHSSGKWKLTKKNNSYYSNAWFSNELVIILNEKLNELDKEIVDYLFLQLVNFVSMLAAV